MLREKFRRLGQVVRRDALIGVGIITPFILTVTAITWTIGKLYKFAVYPILAWLFGAEGIAPLFNSSWLRLVVEKGLLPVLAVTIAVIICVAVARVAKHRTLQILIDFPDWLASRIPGVSSIYAPLRQMAKSMIKSLTAQEFKRVVLIRAPQPGAFLLGFVTKEFEQDGIKVTVCFTGFSPIPTQGPTLYIVDHSLLVETDLGVEEAVGIIISMGIASNEELIIRALRMAKTSLAPAVAAV